MKINFLLNPKTLKRLYLIFAILFAGLIYMTSYPVSMAQEKKKETLKPESKEHPLKELLSGDHFSNPDIKAMQDNPTQNPGNLWWSLGGKLWNTVEGEEKKACVTCHNKAEVSMKGIGSRYPIYNEAQQKLITLEDRINLCRRRFMKAPEYLPESDNLLGISIYVRNQSYGLPLKVKTDGPAKPYFDFGKELYYKKRGQLNMSCASCHEKNVGKTLRSTKLSQGQLNGYPAYRISWKKPGSVLKRINACNTLSRAKHFKYGSRESLALELYLTWRGQGLPIKTPAVRK